MERECNLVGAKARNRHRARLESKARSGQYTCVGCHRRRVVPNGLCWKCEAKSTPRGHRTRRVTGAMSPRVAMGEELRAKFDWLMNGEGLRIKD